MDIEYFCFECGEISDDEDVCEHCGSENLSEIRVW